MNKWKKAKFEEVVNFPPVRKLVRGQLHPYVELSNINIGFKYVYSSENKEYKGSGSKFENGDTLFARITPSLENGKIAQIKGLKKTGFGSGEFFIFSGKEGFTNSDFVYYLSQTKDFRDNAIKSMVGTSGRQRANNKFIAKTIIDLPPLLIQEKIAKILSSYDNLIENNLKRINLLEESARLTYQEWFQHFKIDGKKLDIDPDTKLPFGWEWSKVSSLLHKVKATVKIKSQNILKSGQNPVIDQGVDFIAGYTNETNIHYYIDVPFIVFGDHTRILKFINFSFARGADGTQILISNNSRMSQILLYHSLKALDLSNYFYARHFKFLKEEKIILPKEDISKEFNNRYMIVFEQIKNLRNQNRLLMEARDILLPRLLTGMIDTDDVDIAV